MIDLLFLCPYLTVANINFDLFAFIGLDGNMLQGISVRKCNKNVFLVGITVQLVDILGWRSIAQVLYFIFALMEKIFETN